MKTTSISPANIAFIKYWGQKDKENFLPYNNSISMNLSGCTTKTTVEFRDDISEDQLEIAFEGKGFQQIFLQEGTKNSLLFGQIERIRKLAGISQKVKVLSVNNFPSDAGIAASASGFSALTAALLKAAGLNDLFDNKKKLSDLVRRAGSVSAMRCVLDGFTESCVSGEECFAEQIADEKHFDLVDIIAITDSSQKTVSSSEGHNLAETSACFLARLEELPQRIKRCRQSIVARDFDSLGECMEADTISMHAVMMTSVPPIYYWNEGTMQVINALLKWREQGLQAYFTIDAGPNVHVFCLRKNLAEVKRSLENLDKVLRTITNTPAIGTRIIDEHLF